MSGWEWVAAGVVATTVLIVWRLWVLGLGARQIASIIGQALMLCVLMVGVPVSVWIIVQGWPLLR